MSRIQIVADFVYFNGPPPGQQSGATPGQNSNPQPNNNRGDMGQNRQNYQNNTAKTQNNNSDFNANPWDDVPSYGNGDEYGSSSDDDIPF